MGSIHKYCDIEPIVIIQMAAISNIWSLWLLLESWRARGAPKWSNFSTSTSILALVSMVWAMGLLIDVFKDDFDWLVVLVEIAYLTLWTLILGDLMYRLVTGQSRMWKLVSQPTRPTKNISLKQLRSWQINLIQRQQQKQSSRSPRPTTTHRTTSTDDDDSVPHSILLAERWQSFAETLMWQQVVFFSNEKDVDVDDIQLNSEILFKQVSSDLMHLVHSRRSQIPPTNILDDIEVDPIQFS
eukprot:TRINITY_DN190424_c0_g2_i2.p1 TRINITY_DN190424_c0_g2~~TRINITY_DN190424_c0_g2_i2.p1  ORF type:complete len:241 (+),score=48.70 TRINITY_DN190424_c0_g2_i2:194-916(+)